MDKLGRISNRIDTTKDINTAAVKAFHNRFVCPKHLPRPVENAMKKNLPVTQTEKPFPKGQYLVSKTDLKGVITYVNDAFQSLSGFSREELIGKSHNVVRHPDMPPQAFEDLWHTVKAGRPWRGLVKNRCKDGDFYWVDAFVVPILEHDQTVGYMSVRSEARREEVRQATARYQQLLQSKGKLDSTPALFKRISIKTRLIGILALALVGIAAIAAFGLSNLSASNQNLKIAYTQHLKPAMAIAKMVERMGDNRAQITLSLQHNPTSSYHALLDHPMEKHIEASLKNREIIEALRADYDAAPHSAEEKAIASAFFAARDAFSKEGIGKARDALKAGDYDQVQVLLLKQINPLYEDVVAKGDKLEHYLAKAGELAYAEAEDRYNRLFTLSISVTLLALLFLSVAGMFLVRSIMHPLHRIVGHFKHISQGNLTDEIDISSGDEVGQVQTQLACMQVNLKVMLDEIMTASKAIDSESHRVQWQTSSVVDQSEQQRDRAFTISASTEEFSQSVQQVADSAGETANAADHSQAQVMAAQASMDESMAASSRVVAAVQSSSHTIEALNQATAKIGDITQVIREIADQTNLLALNAAIEAARAGEAGRGFAVVADEVRKLAERTANSTQDIAVTVTEVRKVTERAIKSMENAVTEVESGIGMIRESGQGLSRITATSQEVTAMARGIADAAREQALAGEQVAQNMAKIVGLVDGNLESASEAQRAVSELVATSTELQGLVARFRVINTSAVR